MTANGLMPAEGRARRGRCAHADAEKKAAEARRAEADPQGRAAPRAARKRRPPQIIVRIEHTDGRTTLFDTVSFTDAASFKGVNMLTEFELGMRDETEPGLWLVANWQRVNGPEPAQTAEVIPVATRSHGKAFLLADASELEGVRRVSLDGEDAYLRIDGYWCDMVAFGCAARVHLDASARGVRQQVRELTAALSENGDDAPDVPGVPRELVARLITEVAKDDEIKEEWGDPDEEGW